MDNNKKINELKKILDEYNFYARIATKVALDRDTMCPKNGVEIASKDLNRLWDKLFEIKHSKKYISLIKDLHENNEGLSELDKTLVNELYKDYHDFIKVSAKLNSKCNEAFNNAYEHWMDAKQKKDYSLFEPYLKEAIKYSKLYYSKRENQLETLYDTILDNYEPGWNIKKYDAFFETLKENLVPLIQKVNKSKKKIRDDFLSYNVPIYKQEMFSKYLLEREGHTSDNLTLMETEHPYTSGVSFGDCRISTHYYENNFISNLYSVMHEGGHALFDLYQDKELYDNYLDDRMTMSMHECMSRFFENMISRSASFVHLIYPKLMELFKDELGDVSEKEFFEASNIAQPSLNRCDADELTYCLHIIIRYELEKGFINGEFSTKNLNKRWNKLYKEYLGVKVPDDKEGILQDIHWTDTYGYFPTYALGSAFAAQIYHRMNQDFSIDEAILNDDMKKIISWLKAHAWNKSILSKPDVWIKDVTGEEFNPQYYIDYLKEKYTKLYELDD
jgi:carboxypeptidase Taq